MAMALLISTRRCVDHFFRFFPPELCPEVVELLAAIKMTPRQINYIFRTFKELKQHDPITVSTGPKEVSVESILYLVKTRRKWVAKIVYSLMNLAGYANVATWNGFLFALLSFCTLSKMEMCQVLFLMIAQHTNSWTINYVTSSQLEEFYRDYNDCDEPSFNTRQVNFSQLPLAKYAVNDFTELVFRFSQLITPCMHLQRQLQAALPSLRFWSNYDNIKVLNRKIPVDFFRCPKVMTLLDVAMKGYLEVEDDFDDPRKKLEGEGKDEANTLLGRPMSREKLKIMKKNPPWLDHMIMQNEDPKTGKALGSLAAISPIGADRPYKPPGDLVHKSVEETKAKIRATMAEPGMTAQEIEDEELRRKQEKHARWQRNQELDFVRKSRSEDEKRDNLVAIIDRVVASELITRPSKRVQGHN